MTLLKNINIAPEGRTKGAYHEIYDIIMGLIRLQGISIRHVAMNNQIDGRFDIVNKRLEIRRGVRHTSRGIEALAHEYCHLIQYENGNFPLFFKDLGHFTKRKLGMVARAEMDCAKRAKAFLKQFGVTINPDELKTCNRKEYMDFWRIYYFDDD